MAKTKIEDICEGVKSRLVMQQFAFESSRTAKGKLKVMEGLQRQVAESAKSMGVDVSKADFKNIKNILELEQIFNKTINEVSVDINSLTNALNVLDGISERYSELYDGHIYTE